MDLSDGKIRFHVAHLIEGGLFTEETVERIYISSLFTMDRYFPAFMQHIHAGYTPEDAVFHAELDSHAASVVEEKKPKKKSGTKSGSKSSANKAKSSGASDSSPRLSSIDARLGSTNPTTSSEAPSETPVVHKDQKDDQSQGEKPTAGGEGISGQGELPL